MRKEHAHRLKRHKYNSTNTTIYFCTLPDCNFKIERDLAIGKRASCWRCGEEFFLDQTSLRLARPHCHKCTQSKSIQVSSDEILSGISHHKQEETPRLITDMPRTDFRLEIEDEDI